MANGEIGFFDLSSHTLDVFHSRELFADLRPASVFALRAIGFLPEEVFPFLFSVIIVLNEPEKVLY